MATHPPALELDAAVERRYKGLLFGVRRSIRYHTRRRQFFERFHTAVAGIGVLAGSAAAAAIWNLKPWGVWFAVLVAVASAADLVIGFSVKARLHHDLARRFIEIEKRLAFDQSDELWRWGCEKRLEIEAEEPPKKCVLDTICHNEILRAMGYHPRTDAKHFVQVLWYQRWVAQFFDVNESSLQKTDPC